LQGFHGLRLANVNMSRLVGKSHHRYHRQRVATSIQDVNLQRLDAKPENRHYAKLRQGIFPPVI